jgi:cystathionine beta-lyase/cystathionine gamma-synthase
MNTTPLHPESSLLHEDDALHEGDSLTPAIPWSATFRAADAQAFSRMASQPRHPRYYTRYGNPLHERVARIVARLEGAQAGLVTASGMGAISTALLGLVRTGDRIVAQRNHYMGTTLLLSELLARFGVIAEFVEQTDTDAFARALRTPAAVVMLESPTNPDCSLTDLAAVCELAHQQQARVIVDNTFATPLNQQPLHLGADLVVHSATKYLGGHNDVLGGVVAGPANLISLVRDVRNVLGGILDPHAAYLLLRGIKTLSVRVKQQNATAMAMAMALEGHPRIRRVHYPGLPSHPSHAVAKRLMTGFGGVVTFAIDGDLERTSRFIDALQIPRIGPSLGGVESLVEQPALMSFFELTSEERLAIGMSDDLVRYAVGIEDADDLIGDVMQALERI